MPRNTRTHAHTRLLICKHTTTRPTSENPNKFVVYPGPHLIHPQKNSFDFSHTSSQSQKSKFTNTHSHDRSCFSICLVEYKKISFTHKRGHYHASPPSTGIRQKIMEHVYNWKEPLTLMYWEARGEEKMRRARKKGGERERERERETWSEAPRDALVKRKQAAPCRCGKQKTGAARCCCETKKGVPAPLW